jgi:large subunit ribosomal protein L10
VRREEKVQETKSLTERLEKAKTLIFAEYRGLKVSEMNELRMKLRKEGSLFKVVKNRLMKRVLKDKGLDSLSGHFKGPTAVASSDEDPISPAKVIMNFAKDHDKLVIKGGFMEGSALTPRQVDALAKMPSREELIARALGSMVAPARNFACVLAAVPRKLVYAVNAIKEKKA